MADQLAILRKGYQGTRIAAGAALLVAPSLAGRLLGADLDATGQVVARLLGSRDALLGVGQLLAERHHIARGWYEAAAAADLCDAVVLAGAGMSGVLPRRRALLGVAVAAAGAVLGMLLARSEPPVDSLEAELAALTRAEQLSR